MSVCGNFVQGCGLVECVDYGLHEIRFRGERAFGEMPERNIITWHTMLIGYTDNMKIDKARELFNQMGQRNIFS